MRITTLTMAAVFSLSASAAFAEGCNWGAYAEAPKMSKMTEHQQVASAPVPVDAWLIKYLDAWEKA